MFGVCVCACVCVCVCVCVFALSIESQDSLHGNVDASKVVLLKHGLNHGFTVLFGIQWGLGQKNLRRKVQGG